MLCNQSGQALQEYKDKKDQEEKFHQEFEGFLDYLKDNPEMLKEGRLKYLREFISLSTRFPNVYDFHCDGDNTIQMPLPSNVRGAQPTKGYVESVANLNNEDSCDNPILTVLIVNPFWKSDRSNYADIPQKIKYTELTLVDGDGQKIHSRLNKNLVEIGCMLKRGDMLCLDLFTIVRFRINEESPYMPMLFVHNLSRVGTEPLYDSSIKQDMLVCHHSTPTIESSHGDSPPIDPRINPKPQCTSEQRLCAIHGIYSRLLLCYRRSRRYVSKCFLS